MSGTYHDLAEAALTLARDLRQHFPICGEPVPPSGGPTAHTFGLLLVKWQRFGQLLSDRGDIPAMSDEDQVLLRDAVARLHKTYHDLGRHYCFDRLLQPAENGVRVGSPNISPLEPAVVSRLEWSANRLDPKPVKDEGGSDPRDTDEHYVRASTIEHIFGFKHKKLLSFLKAHREIKRKRPISAKGTPHPQRLLVHILDFFGAIRRDSIVADSPALARRIETNLHRAKLDEKIEAAALAMFLGK